MIPGLVRSLRRLLGRALALLPSPPDRTPSAPDVDGRRPDVADTTAIELEMLRKDGHGGIR